MVLLLVASAVSLVSAEETEADDDVEIDEETETEIEVMDISEGAEARLLQLQISIKKSLLNGYLIVDSFNAVYGDEVDTTDLENILYELEAVLEDVQAVDPSDENAAQYFVEYKQDAIDIVKSWRETAGALKQSLKGTDEWDSFVDLVKEGIKEIPNDEDVTALREEFKAVADLHNSKRLQTVAEYLGKDLDELITQIENGEITRAEINKQLKEVVSEMSLEEKKEAFGKLKAKKLQMQIRARNFIRDVEEGYRPRKMQRDVDRVPNIENIRNRRQNQASS